MADSADKVYIDQDTEKQTPEGVSDNSCSDEEVASCSKGLLSSETYYQSNSPLVLEIRKKMNGIIEGFTLRCLEKDAYKMRIFYLALKKLGIGCVIVTENGVLNVNDIVTNYEEIWSDLLENISEYDKEAFISMKDLIYEDYKITFEQQHLDMLMSKWVATTDPSKSDVEEVLESFKLPVERNVVKRMAKRKVRLVQDIKKNLGQYSEEEMMMLKQDIFDSYRVEIADTDLTDIILKWTDQRVVRILLMKANGMHTGQGLLLELLSDTENYTKKELLAHKTRLYEHQFTELFISWVDKANPSDSDVRDVWSSVDVSELCARLEWGVVRRVSRGVTVSDSTDYKYSHYYWQLIPTNVKQLITQGYFTLCSVSGDYNIATQCKIAQCNEGTHPCYTLTVHDGRYCIVDSEKCAEGVLAHSSNKGKKGHSHTGSVLHYWLELDFRYHSLVASSKEDTDAKMKDHISRGGNIGICLMFDPKHED